MKHITVLRLESTDHSSAGLTLCLNSSERHWIDQVPWPSYPCKPDASFAIGYNDQYIFLKYFVQENAVRAAVTNRNGPVWEDSCVEFFICFDDKGYYNLEFNCLGVAHVGFGKEKCNRQMIPEDIISKITTESMIHKHRSGLVEWELLLSIPMGVFVYHPLSSISGKQFRANFYKCGDLLPEPHYLSWTEIHAAEPNFHLPQFFGTLYFK